MRSLEKTDTAREDSLQTGSKTFSRAATAEPVGSVPESGEVPLPVATATASPTMDGGAGAVAMGPEQSKWWFWLLVALALAIAAIALSVACYVHTRSSTTTSSKGRIKASETFSLVMGEGTQAKKVEGTLAQDTEMGLYASQLNPMFQMDLSEGGSDSALYLDGGAMSPVLGSDRDGDREREVELKPRFMVPGPCEYGGGGAG
jgi:hypothetical protein